MKTFRKTQENALEGHFKEINSICFTSDYKYVISGPVDSTIRIWK